jgi:hypothetical protein
VVTLLNETSLVCVAHALQELRNVLFFFGDVQHAGRRRDENVRSQIAALFLVRMSVCRSLL